MLLPILAVLIALATGIDRTWDGNLAALAQQRSIEVSVTWGHREMPELAGYNWGEVIASNNATDPYAQAVAQWQGSPPHWAILMTPEYRFVACAETVTNIHYIICLFTDRGYVSSGTIIPDTALEEPMNATLTRFVEAFVAIFVVAFAADPIFSGGSVNLFGEGGLQALVTAAVAAALLAVRRVLATRTS